MPTLRLPRTAAVLVLLLACLGRPALAASSKDAKKIYEEATAAFGLGKYAVAAERYEAAFAIRPDPALLYNAAQSFRLAGNKQRALELYRNYARLYSDGSNADDARAHVAALKKEIEEGAGVHPAPALPVTPLAPAMPPPVESVPPAPAPVPAAVPPAPAPANGVAMLTTSGAPSDEQRPLTHKVWFWIAVGAGAVALTTVLLLATRSETFPEATFGTARGN
jgi:tetratricopeptide (TPR) repeat protein